MYFFTLQVQAPSTDSSCNSRILYVGHIKNLVLFLLYNTPLFIKKSILTFHFHTFLNLRLNYISLKETQNSKKRRS